ncbi:MAG: pyridoxamine 5'-phosphate oxidase family protein, partial [Acidimicrobiales bacterium]
MTVTEPGIRNRVKRHPERAAYDRESVHAVLDAAPMGHLGFVVNGQPFVIPMLYGRIDD